MKKVLKLGFIAASSLSLITLSSAFAGFTTAKGKYDFAAEYAGAFVDNSYGDKHGIYRHDIEINNDFGITDNQSVGLDLFFGKPYNILSSNTDGETWSSSFQVRHKINFEASESVNFAVQNAFYVKEVNIDDKAYAARWELRGIVGHNGNGFYNHSRLELSYRKFLNLNDTLDVLRVDLRTKFKLTDSIKWLAKVHFYFLLGDKEMEAKNPDQRINKFKPSETIIYTGPEFSLSNGNSMYIYYTMQIDASKASKNHSKGLAIGYSKSFDL